MRRSFSLATTFITLSLIFVSILALTISYKGITNSGVLGAKVSKNENPLLEHSSGILITITSKFGSWDLYELLRNTEEGCSSGFDTGKLVERIGGGITDEHEIIVTPSDSWKEYSFLKLSIKSGWNTSPRSFFVSSDFSNYKVLKFPEDTVSILIPITDIFEKQVLIDFSDTE